MIYFDSKFKADHIQMRAIKRKTAIITAERDDIFPDAIGRLHFRGCLRSDSASFISLIMYTIEAVNKNIIKHADVLKNEAVMNN